MVIHLHYPLIEFLSEKVSIKRLKRRVFHKSVINAFGVPIKALWSTVVFVHSMGKNLGSVPKVVVERSPDELHLRLVQPLSFILVVKSG